MRNRYQAYVTFSSQLLGIMALILIVSYRISQPKDNHVAVS